MEVQNIQKMQKKEKEFNLTAAHNFTEGIKRITSLGEY